MRADRVNAARSVGRVEPADRGSETNSLSDRGRTGLEPLRRRRELHLVVGDLGDHVAATEQRLGLQQPIALAVQHADAGRAIGLVPGPDVEVRVDRAHVDRDLRHGLRSVDHRDDAVSARLGHDLGNRVDRAQHVRHVGQRQQASTGQERRHRLAVEPPIVQDGHLDELGTDLLGQAPPRHEVRVMLHPRDENPIPCPHVRLAPPA